MLRRLPLLALFIGLTACVSFGGGGVQSLALSGGAIMAKGPEGYCVDVSNSRPFGGFAALASCSILTDTPAQSRVEGFITIQVGGRNSAIVAGSQRELARLLRSNRGTALLSSNGDANTVETDSVSIEGPAVVVHFTDTGTPAIAGVEQEEWRAFLDLRGRLITIGVRGFATSPLSRSQGHRLLDSAISALQNANNLDTVVETEG